MPDLSTYQRQGYSSQAQYDIGKAVKFFGNAVAAGPQVAAQIAHQEEMAILEKEERLELEKELVKMRLAAKEMARLEEELRIDKNLIALHRGIDEEVKKGNIKPEQGRMMKAQTHLEAEAQKAGLKGIVGGYFQGEKTRTPEQITRDRNTIESAAEESQDPSTKALYRQRKIELNQELAQSMDMSYVWLPEQVQKLWGIDRLWPDKEAQGLFLPKELGERINTLIDNNVPYEQIREINELQPYLR